MMKPIKDANEDDQEKLILSAEEGEDISKNTQIKTVK